MRKARRAITLNRETYYRLDALVMRGAVGGISGQAGPNCISVPPNCDSTNFACATALPCSYGGCGTGGGNSGITGCPGCAYI